MTAPVVGSPRAIELARQRASDDATWTRTGEGGAWRIVVTPPMGKALRAVVALHAPAGAPMPILLDVLDLSRETARRKVTESAAEMLDESGVAALANELCSIGMHLAARPRDGSGDDASAPKGFTLADPEPWPEPVDGAELLGEVAAFLSARVVLPPRAADVLALWLAHSYVFGVWPVTPYLRAISPIRACGKTLVLDIAGALAPRALNASDATPAAIFRVIEKWKPVLILDEIDSWLTGDRESGTVNLLNAGSRAGGRALRCTGEGASLDVTGFGVFCPKILAGITAAIPGATASRCIVLRLERATPEQLAELIPFSALDATTAAPLASRLARWTADALESGSLAQRVALPAGISGRDADLWAPLVSVADAAGSRWPEAARSAAIAFTGAAALDEPRDLAENALRDALDYCHAHPAVPGALVPSAALRDWLTADPLRPWQTLKRDGLSEKQLAAYLKRFGVNATRRRDGGEKVRGYPRAELLAAAARYCPDLEIKHSSPPGEVAHVAHVAQIAGAEPLAGLAGGPHVPLVPHGPHTRGGENVLFGGNGRQPKEPLRAAYGDDDD